VNVTSVRQASLRQIVERRVCALRAVVSNQNLHNVTSP
jgi:hypothetical protein